MCSFDRLESLDNKSLYKFSPFKFTKIKQDYAGEWPKARSGHRIVGNHKELFMYGGYNPDIPNNDPDLRHDINWSWSKPLFREIWKFNIGKNIWKKLHVLNIPKVLASNAVILQGNMLMVYGGTGVPFGRQCSNLLYVCNISNNIPKFKKFIATGVFPRSMYGQAIFIYKKFLYIIGGTNGFNFFCDIHRLNLDTSRWEIVYENHGLPDDPSGRYRHEIGLQLDMSKFYLFGGGTSFDSFGFKHLPVFNLEKNIWTTVYTFGDSKINENCGYPLPRKCHSLVQNGDDIFINGGECDRKILFDTWKFNLKTLKWTCMKSMELESPRYFHGATITPNGKMYIFGGVTATGRSSEMINAWLCIPKLQEICWDAVVHYNLLKDIPNECLQQFLPPSFYKRLE